MAQCRKENELGIEGMAAMLLPLLLLQACLFTHIVRANISTSPGFCAPFVILGIHSKAKSARSMISAQRGEEKRKQYKRGINWKSVQ
jgi:hypothetical protein